MLLGDLPLQNVNFFNYLNKTGCSTVDGVDDAHEFTATMVIYFRVVSVLIGDQHVLGKKNAMKAVGIQDHEQQEILRLCMAILWIGQITFKNNHNDESAIEDHKGNSQG